MSRPSVSPCYAGAVGSLCKVHHCGIRNKSVCCCKPHLHYCTATAPRFLLSVQTWTKSHTAVSQKYRLGELSKDVFCIGGTAIGETREEGERLKSRVFVQNYIYRSFTNRAKKSFVRKSFISTSPFLTCFPHRHSPLRQALGPTPSASRGDTLGRDITHAISLIMPLVRKRKNKTRLLTCTFVKSDARFGRRLATPIDFGRD